MLLNAAALNTTPLNRGAAKGVELAAFVSCMSAASGLTTNTVPLAASVAINNEVSASVDISVVCSALSNAISAASSALSLKNTQSGSSSSSTHIVTGKQIGRAHV